MARKIEEAFGSKIRASLNVLEKGLGSNPIRFGVDSKTGRKVFFQRDRFSGRIKIVKKK